MRGSFAELQDTHLLEGRLDRAVVHLFDTRIALEHRCEFFLRRLLPNDHALLLGDSLNEELVLLGADVEFVDDVPEEIERRRAGLAEHGEVAVVVVEERVDGLPRGAGGDLVCGDELVEESLRACVGSAPKERQTREANERTEKSSRAFLALRRFSSATLCFCST